MRVLYRMGLLDQVSAFFSSSSVQSETSDNKKRLHQIDFELSHASVVLYRDTLVLPAFAQSLAILIKQLKTVLPLLNTVFSKNNVEKRNQYLDVLITTGFSRESKAFLQNLAFKQREKELIENHFLANTLEMQQTYLTAILQETTESAELKEIENVLRSMEQLYDLASYDFNKIMRMFNQNAVGVFQSVGLLGLESFLSDYFSIICSFQPTAALGRALCALGIQEKNTTLSKDEADIINSCLIKINAVISKVITEDLVKKLIWLIKQDITVQPEKREYPAHYINDFVQRLQTTFSIDSAKIKEQIQKNQFESEMQLFFGENEILHIDGYSFENNTFIREKTNCSFLYIMPLQLLKNFSAYFLSEKKVAILKTVVVEGYFSDATEQTEFSNYYFACTQIRAAIEEFEKSFELGGSHDFKSLSVFIQNAKNSPDFEKQLEKKLLTINVTAKSLLETHHENLMVLTQLAKRMYDDAKKPKPDYIVNVKLLFSSTRNKDNADILEQNLHLWFQFVEIVTRYMNANTK